MKSFRDPVDEWLKETVGGEANTMITELSKLTDIEYDFCRAFVLCGSPAEAAKRVKMPASRSPALLVHLPKIAACINILTAKRESALGQKSAAEVLERLAGTSLLGADDFGTSEAAVKEREKLLDPKSEAITKVDDEELANNLLTPDLAAAQIMQLPKVNVPAAQNFGAPWVIERCVTIAERCMQIEAVFDRKGRPIGQFTFNVQGALKALDMLGKTMAMFKDKVEISGELSTFKTSELDDRIKALLEANPALASVIEVKAEASK